MVATFAPADVGEKVTVKLPLEPPVTEVAALERANSEELVPVKVIPVIFKVAFPVFSMVKVTGAPLDPTKTFGKVVLPPSIIEVVLFLIFISGVIAVG